MRLAAIALSGFAWIAGLALAALWCIWSALKNPHFRRSQVPVVGHRHARMLAFPIAQCFPGIA